MNNLEQEFENQINWMQSLISNGVSSAANDAAPNDYEMQINDLIASIKPSPKTSDAFGQVSPLIRDIVESEDKPEAGNRTLSTDNRQYRISDVVDDEEEEDDCEEYYVEDAAEIRGQEIPNWARAANLLVELQQQASVDPDKIFKDFERTCDLSTMFEKKKRCFKVRGDSGWWQADGLTPDEEAKYKKAVGLA